MVLLRGRLFSYKAWMIRLAVRERQLPIYLLELRIWNGIQSLGSKEIRMAQDIS